MLLSILNSNCNFFQILSRCVGLGIDDVDDDGDQINSNKFIIVTSDGVCRINLLINTTMLLVCYVCTTEKAKKVSKPITDIQAPIPMTFEFCNESLTPGLEHICRERVNFICDDILYGMKLILMTAPASVDMVQGILEILSTYFGKFNDGQMKLVHCTKIPKGVSDFFLDLNGLLLDMSLFQWVVLHEDNIFYASSTNLIDERGKWCGGDLF